jgi:hypothetical protein
MNIIYSVVARASRRAASTFLSTFGLCFRGSEKRHRREGMRHITVRISDHYVLGVEKFHLQISGTVHLAESKSFGVRGDAFNSFNHAVLEKTQTFSWRRRIMLHEV